jgi:hypothetical protein
VLSRTRGKLESRVPQMIHLCHEVQRLNKRLNIRN